MEKQLIKVHEKDSPIKFKQNRLLKVLSEIRISYQLFAYHLKALRKKKERKYPGRPLQPLLHKWKDFDFNNFL